jgi:hypothetical protein
MDATSQRKTPRESKIREAQSSSGNWIRTSDTRLINPATYSVGIWLGRTNAEDIDASTCAASLTVESDPHAGHGSQRFPGFYLCRFTHEVSLVSQAMAAA